jgi:hypothetical protein
MAEPAVEDSAVPAPQAPPRTDRSPWNWLLVVPIVVPLLTPLFNADSPRLFGFPMFYWLQFAFILLGVGATSIVYQKTKSSSRRPSGGDDRVA